MGMIIGFPAGGGATFDITPYLPIRAVMWHIYSIVLSGAAMTANFLDTVRHAEYGYQSPGANADAFTNSCILKAGTYTFSVLGITNAPHGKIDWYKQDPLDGSYQSFITGQDWYSASPVNNVVKTGDITVNASGLVRFKGVVNGKNGSSSGYVIALTTMVITPSAD
jgi:hypothetical protein